MHATRIDLQLQSGNGTAPRVRRPALRAQPGWSANWCWRSPATPPSASATCRAPYQVNLTGAGAGGAVHRAFGVLGAGLSVAQRGPQFALLAVLGATPRQRLALVLVLSAALGLLERQCWALPWAPRLAATALQLLGGDLGGGYFAGVRPALQERPCRAGWCGALAWRLLAGGWWPACAAQTLPPLNPGKPWRRSQPDGTKGPLVSLMIATGALLIALHPYLAFHWPRT